MEPSTVLAEPNTSAGVAPATGASAPVVPEARPAAGTKGSRETGGAPTVRWDDSKIRSAYANVCNVSSTREEVVLMFGISQGWQAGQQQVTVDATDRVILSPHAAKRMTGLLNSFVQQYEAKYGLLG